MHWYTRTSKTRERDRENTQNWQIISQCKHITSEREAARAAKKLHKLLSMQQIKWNIYFWVFDILICLLNENGTDFFCFVSFRWLRKRNITRKHDKLNYLSHIKRNKSPAMSSKTELNVNKQTNKRKENDEQKNTNEIECMEWVYATQVCVRIRLHHIPSMPKCHSPRSVHSSSSSRRQQQNQSIVSLASCLTLIYAVTANSHNLIRASNEFYHSTESTRSI